MILITNVEKAPIKRNLLIVIMLSTLSVFYPVDRCAIRHINSDLIITRVVCSEGVMKYSVDFVGTFFVTSKVSHS